jgi:hypothetical protein
MQYLFDRSFASAVVNSALACNIFEIPFVARRAVISFIAGQPLGYYSSWPLFFFSGKGLFLRMLALALG